MKKIIAVALIIISVLLVSCTKTDTTVPAGMQLASSVASDYYLYVPEHWIIAEQGGLTSAYVSDSDKTNVSCARTSITDEIRNAEVDPERSAALVYAEKFFESYKNSLELLPEFELLSTTNAVLDGKPCIRYKYKTKLNEKVYEYDMLVCVPAGVYAYMLTYTAEDSKFDDNKAAFESIISAFKFQAGILE